MSGRLLFVLIGVGLLVSACSNAETTPGEKAKSQYTQKLGDYGLLGIGPGGPGHGY